MKNKKLISMILICTLFMMFTLTACGKEEDGEDLTDNEVEKTEDVEAEDDELEEMMKIRKRKT